MARRPAIIALLAAVAVLVASCSSGSGKHATPTTTTPVSPSHVVANLGRCSPKFLAESLNVLNAGVLALDKKLVPLAAMKVRICVYFGLDIRSAVLSGAEATHFEEMTNSLPAWVTPSAQTRSSC